MLFNQRARARGITMSTVQVTRRFISFCWCIKKGISYIQMLCFVRKPPILSRSHHAVGGGGGFPFQEHEERQRAPNQSSSRAQPRKSRLKRRTQRTRAINTRKGEFGAGRLFLRQDGNGYDGSSEAVTHPARTVESSASRHDRGRRSGRVGAGWWGRDGVAGGRRGVRRRAGGRRGARGRARGRYGA